MLSGYPKVYRVRSVGIGGSAYSDYPSLEAIDVSWKSGLAVTTLPIIKLRSHASTVCFFLCHTNTKTGHIWPY